MTGETRRTLLFATAAAILALLAWATAPAPATARTDADLPFFPSFTDPNAATAVEIVEADTLTSELRAFHVAHRDGRWTIPSHGNYPADGETRLSSIAAALVSLRRTDPAGDVAADHADFGVLDPLDDAQGTAEGRGVRVTVRGINDVVIADLIIGYPLDGRPGRRYVRHPDERQVYVADLGGLALSTRFDDWIERNLLLVGRGDLDQIVIRNYTADPTAGTIDERDRVLLRSASPDTWTAEGLRAGERLDSFTMNLMVTRLVELQLAGVIPKPPSVAERLSQPGGTALAPDDVRELAARGFYFTRDGRLLSSHGEVLVHTRSGIFYVLRFGEPAVIPGAALPGRYLFISTGYDGPSGTPPPGEVRDRLDLLRARFAPWYYVVPDEDVLKIRVPRADLIRSDTAAR